MSDAIHLSKEAGVARITLARPAKLNVLDAAMIAALVSAADAIEADGDVRVAILTGEGKAFCAGGDIAAWGGLEPLDMWRHWVSAGHRAFDRLARLRVPLIAVLNGHSLGGGLELAATADFRIAEEQARLGMPETGIGMVPGWSGTQRLVRRFGARVMRRLALSGAIVGAAEAERLGLVDEVVPQGQGIARAQELAAAVAARGPVAVAIAKQLINAAEGEETAAAMEAIAGALTSYTDDLKEGVASFREKRAPTFANR
ncbi:MULTISPECIES: enoyl-CoA hydratase/isomerase family protein [unclassified Bradyrhizobium]|uniref:enoyl-CoA hydratase/isomerase family protein n=1 Tax=unclassified Bradyrhizobium TaxID=2631580 RepID=UPI001FFA37A4|nr:MULTISPECIES: enoyl-CoA hydratase/isomerase family protein [unclassified Bradyrhizobium]MCK1708323.1 enoyl-CoA hydratase/isomerase family protein [Bradyrhizobium sp. 143]MCK1724175.1 enoyl-CoA hydratase/isomerase family protein [Bradyrhizobium sp. 142]